MENWHRSLTYFSPKRTFRVWAWAVPCFNTPTVESGVFFCAWLREIKIMRRRTASHCVFRRIGPSKTLCDESSSKIPFFYTLTVDIDVCLVRGDPSWVGCFGGLPRIVYFAELGPRKYDVKTTPQRSPVLTRSPSRLICVWCVETEAEWDAAVGWLALRFSPNGPSKTRSHDDSSKIPCFYTIDVEIDICLVRGDPS